jgi:1,2-diacylglycerol 3-beta-glucosyltransferase
MSILLASLLWLLAASLTLAVLQLWVLAAVALRPARGAGASGPGRSRFIIVVPAHDEETDLPRLLTSLGRLDYPADRFAVWVVADNCTDRTADIAREAGVCCIERADPFRRGKGYALSAALERAAKSECDAVVVIDADSVVSSNLLRAFEARLASGAAALQSAYRLAAGVGSWSVWLAVENFLEDRLFYEAKERLGYATLLRGNGMCFSRDLLRRVPFGCASITEDVEYTFHLVRAGVFPRFVPQACVVSRAPSTFRQISQQRRRWSTGHFQLVLRESPRMLLWGLRRGDFRLVEFATSVLVTSKSALALLSLAGLGAAVAGQRVLGSNLTLVWPFVGVLLAISLYFAMGVVACRMPVRHLLGVAGLPVLVLWRLASHISNALTSRNARWVRTARD